MQCAVLTIPCCLPRLAPRSPPQLLERRRVISAVELYRAANKSPEAAKLLARLARTEGTEKRNLLRAKKLQVLAALEVERFRKRVLDTQTTAVAGQTAAQTTAATLANLMTHDSTQMTGVGGSGGDKEDARVLDAAWRGAPRGLVCSLDQ